MGPNMPNNYKNLLLHVYSHTFWVKLKCIAIVFMTFFTKCLIFIKEDPRAGLIWQKCMNSKNMNS